MKRRTHQRTQQKSAIRHLRLIEQETARKSGVSVAKQLNTSKASAAVTFGGQGIGYLDEMAELLEGGGLAARLIQRAARVLEEMSERQQVAWSGMVSQGCDLMGWLSDASSRPESSYLSSSFFSQPLIFTTQVARFASCWEMGLREAFEAGSIVALSGHSQGVMAATLVSESPNGKIDEDRFATYVEYFCWQGLHMGQSDPPAAGETGACMAAVSKVKLSKLEGVIGQVNRRLPEDKRVIIALQNTRTRNVISGHPSPLKAVKTALEMVAEKEKAAKKAGRFGGTPLDYTWEDLPVGAAFHTHHMGNGAVAMTATLGEMGFKIAATDLKIPVYLCDGENMLGGDVMAALIESQFVNPVRWQKTLLQLTDTPEITHVLDMGPSDAVARLSMASLRGTGVVVLPMSLGRGRQECFEGVDAPIPVQYAQFAPKLAKLPNGNIIVDNLYTRSTGESPVILPGMTPTTVDAPIVAAGANEGFTSELAGGGQVTEQMFRLRVEELKDLLTPGAEVVFNSLYLDPYLWGLHLRKAGLVQKLKKEGAPIKGVTVSAGLPDVDEATALLNELESIGIWHNAFKPGNVAQVRHVCKIAAANEEKTIFVHVEGGKAGGHHSWEDLDELLLETYHLLRAQRNLVVCVGGGIASEERGVELLTGTWSERYGLVPMPVDAILLGTVTMAAKEATATTSVKKALAKAAGCDEWVFAGEIGGGVTSGKSQLNADIHYVDNSASKCGRLLDQVAGDADAVAARREEIIAALNKTCKPYFGDLESMTYGETLERMVSLMAVGESSAYEDGIWPDITYRQRVADFIRMAEGRLSGQENGTFEGIVGAASELDAPAKVVARFRKTYENADQVTMHPSDVDTFIYKICARPGKPVNFIPVINEDVRRWFKSDSLWQAQNSNYTADQVLIIPGPEAVRGIEKANEPIADLLGRYEAALVRELQENDSESSEVTGPWNLFEVSEWPETRVEIEGNVTTLKVTDTVETGAWFSCFGANYQGPVAALLSVPRIFQSVQSAENPVQLLCKPRKGASFRVQQEKSGEVSGILYLSPEGEKVSIGRTDDGALSVVATPDLAGGAKYPLSFMFEYKAIDRTGVILQGQESYDQSVADFYQESLFGKSLEAPELFSTYATSLVIDGDRVRAYHSVTGGLESTEVPMNMAFSLAWEPVFTVMSTPDLSRGLLRLVHLSNDFETHSGWPLTAGETVEVSARVSRVENRNQGRTIETVATLSRDGEPCLTLTSAFFVRQAFGQEAVVQESWQWKTWSLQPATDAEAEVLSTQSFIELQKGIELHAGERLEAEVDLREKHSRDGEQVFRAEGTLMRGGDIIGRIEGAWDVGFEAHPVRALFDAVESVGNHEVPTARLTLGKISGRTPGKMNTFAEVGLDKNSIHVSRLMAGLGGLDDVIVHGMWTSARVHAFLVNDVLKGKSNRIRSFKGEFLAPAYLGEAITMSAARIGAVGGDEILELRVEANREGSAVPLMTSRARIAPPTVAYVFPGQGIQQKGMGMAAYASSTAARQIWERADRFTRTQLGFSILKIVRENPREILVNGTPQIHDKGVIHLTQFTQVAMAVLAQAQVAQMEEGGILNPDAIVCGHSVGEYNAIGALGGVLPLETIIQTVYERGCEMHRLVARDERGESGFRMGVIRPHYAKLDESAAETLVNDIEKETGLTLQIVNYNIMGRQYSVVGKIESIRILQERLNSLAPAGAKSPYVEVPGIDVPFHSRVLSGGVARFRDTLNSRFPKEIPVHKLVGRYIPNLVPKAFTLDKAYVEEVQQYTDSEPLQALLKDWAKASKDDNRVGRTLLIELLAWQFASPVRWIETQSLLLNRQEFGGMEVDEVLELGVGYQPTLSNMAKYTKTLLQATAGSAIVRNVEADGDEVFFQVADPVVEEVVEEVEDTGSEAPVSAAVPQAAPVAAPATAPAAGPVEDQAFTVAEALKGMLALQGKLAVSQIGMGETIDEIFDGVSSRRNQVLMDIGAEFNLGTIDGAHEQPLTQLIGEIERRAAQYKSMGKYLTVAVDEALKRALGRAGMSRKDTLAYFASTFGMGEGLSQSALLALALETREGDSARGGALGTKGGATPASKAEAHGLLDEVVGVAGSAKGVSLQKQGGGSAAGGAAVDAAVVRELEEKIAGRDGALMRVAQDLAAHLGHQLTPNGPGLSSEPADTTRLNALIAEHSTAYEELVQPRFSAKKHVGFTSGWAWAQRDVARMAYEAGQGRLDDKALLVEASRLGNRRSARVDATAEWYRQWAEAEGHKGLKKALDSLLSGEGTAPLHWTPSRPSLKFDDQGGMHYEEVPVSGTKPVQSFVKELGLTGAKPTVICGQEGAWNKTLNDVMKKGASERLSFAGRTVVVTGAGPNSIAMEMVKHYLHGGARVIVTTSSYHAQRLGVYRKLYQDFAGAGSELHVVPFNQTSLQDVDALVEWLFSTQTEQAGAEVKVTKRPFVPDLLVPFAAIKDLATMDGLGARSQAALRTMLLSVETLIAGIARKYMELGVPETPCHVVLPLSPNHGVFGGDGTYAETKAALEVLAHKWHSEKEAWGACTTLCMAKIGWVRGTGLMDANNPVAAELEERTSVRTFSNGEMASMLVALSSDEARKEALTGPLQADLTGGFAAIENLKGVVDQIRVDLEQRGKDTRVKTHLTSLMTPSVGGAVAADVQALPNWPATSMTLVEEPLSGAQPVQVSLEDMIVIIGSGELGPCGTSRTRFELEVSDQLSPAAVLELAWMTGLIRHEESGRGGVWKDLETGEELKEYEIAERYHDTVKERVGLRFVDPEDAGFDPRALEVMTPVFLEKDMTFSVSSEDEARIFVESEPETTRAHFDEEQEVWKVTRQAGSEIRVPRKTRLNRFVMGQIPSGFDVSRYGIPKDMEENTDRLTLFNLIATVDAFLSAGLTPEELMKWVHPARVANTQGCGIGGMESLQRLYTDPVLDRERQGDVLQETLINVIAGYVVQSYVGSYGSMSHPVAACATAAVSLEEAMDKIRVGKADVVVAGGYDDIGRAGVMGFADMNATHNTDEMLAMGLEPHQFSRSNDVRRKGFVEAQGGGTFLVTRGDLALKMGVPVRAVVGYAASFGDGIQKSVPAPGMGGLAAALGGMESPLAKSLDSFGLKADDIGLVYKHDTSTNANDPNENKLHDKIQRALGRTPGNPLWVVSQKTLTGHSKGGAAAWQMGGMLQMMAKGLIPGNKNLDSVDPVMESFGHMAFTDQSLEPGPGSLKAGLITSLGFGHVSGLALVLHPGLFLQALDGDERETYLARVRERRAMELSQLTASFMGRAPLYEKRGHRRFDAADGSQQQVQEEVELLTRTDYRLQSNGVYGPEESA